MLTWYVVYIWLKVNHHRLIRHLDYLTLILLALFEVLLKFLFHRVLVDFLNVLLYRSLGYLLSLFCWQSRLHRMSWRRLEICLILTFETWIFIFSRGINLWVRKLALVLALEVIVNCNLILLLILFGLLLLKLNCFVVIEFFLCYFYTSEEKLITFLHRWVFLHLYVELICSAFVIIIGVFPTFSSLIIWIWSDKPAIVILFGLSYNRSIVEKKAAVYITTYHVIRPIKITILLRIKMDGSTLRSHLEIYSFVLLYSQLFL